MKLVVTGAGSDGRSTVVSEGPLGEIPDGEKGSRNDIWTTHTGSSSVPVREGQIPSGTTVTFCASLEAGHEVPMHQNTSEDVLVILEGSLELQLETGSVWLRDGDVFVVPRTVHGIRVGPEGVVLTATCVGVPDGADEEASGA